MSLSSVFMFCLHVSVSLYQSSWEKRWLCCWLPSLSPFSIRQPWRCRLKLSYKLNDLFSVYHFLIFFFKNHFKPCESIQTKFYLANKHNETKGFNGLCPQTMVTPLTQKYFSFGELENSVMYFLGGVVVIAGFLFVRWLSRHVRERVILAIGLCMCNISCIWCLIFLAKPLG